MNILGSIAKGVQKIASGIAKTAKQAAQKIKSTASKAKNKIKSKRTKEKPKEEPTQEPAQEPQEEPTQEPSEEPKEEYQKYNYNQLIISNFISKMREIADEVISERESRRDNVNYWYNSLLNFIQHQDEDALADCIEENAESLIMYIERCFWSSNQQASAYYNIVITIIRSHIVGARTLINESVQDTQDFYFNEDI